MEQDALTTIFKQVPRREFLPLDMRQYADTNRPLPIGYNQTNSQPSTIRQMLEWLEVKSGDKVLDVGSGSGWTTALLSCLAGKHGKVFAVEKIPGLVKFGADNCEKLDLHNVEFHLAGNEFGLPEEAPFNAILVSASANELPPELINQLAPGGRMVIPVNQDILVVRKHEDGMLQISTHAGYVFVPLVRRDKH